MNATWGELAFERLFQSWFQSFLLQLILSKGLEGVFNLHPAFYGAHECWTYWLKFDISGCNEANSTDSFDNFVYDMFTWSVNNTIRVSTHGVPKNPNKNWNFRYGQKFQVTEACIM